MYGVLTLNVVCQSRLGAFHDAHPPDFPSPDRTPGRQCRIGHRLLQAANPPRDPIPVVKHTKRGVGIIEIRLLRILRV